MIVAYAIPVIEKTIPSTYRNVEISSELEMRKNAMLKEVKSFHKNNTWELLKLPKGKKSLAVSGYL